MELIDEQDSSLLSSRVSKLRFYLETKKCLKYLFVLSLFISCLCISILVFEVNDGRRDNQVHQFERWEERLWQSYDQLVWGEDTHEPITQSQFYRKIIAAAYCSNGEKDRAAGYGYRCV